MPLPGTVARNLGEPGCEDGTGTESCQRLPGVRLSSTMSWTGAREGQRRTGQRGRLAAQRESFDATMPLWKVYSRKFNLDEAVQDGYAVVTERATASRVCAPGAITTSSRSWQAIDIWNPHFVHLLQALARSGSSGCSGVGTRALRVRSRGARGELCVREPLANSEERKGQRGAPPNSRQFTSVSTGA